jgi:phosphinothricin acetyltransferase
MGFTVRAAEFADVPEITAIYGDSVTNGTASFELTPPDSEEMARRFAALGAAGYPWFAAVSGGGLVGYAYASPYRPRPGYGNTVEDSVYVAPKAQGRGVGRALLTALIDRCAVEGFRQMIAVIGDSGNAASIRLHDSLGFTLTGTFTAVGWKHGRWLDSVLMQRPLGPGAGTPPTRASAQARLG